MTTESIGKTFLGRDIPLFHLGEGVSRVLVVGGVHAREHITSDLIFLLMEREVAVNIDCVPTLNLDGVALAKYGVSSAPENYRARLLAFNKGKEDFSLWKANANGVDINVNFDADWGKGEKNVTVAGSENYIGFCPESEPETKAVCDVIRKNKYALVVAYHSLGEEIYWGYGKNNRFFRQAKRASEYLGYPLLRSERSAGGLKDWYSLMFDGLGLTVEIGKSEWGHPCPVQKLDELSATHRGSFLLWETLGDEIAREIHERGFETGKESIY